MPTPAPSGGSSLVGRRNIGSRPPEPHRFGRFDSTDIPATLIYMGKVALRINGRVETVDVPADTPLLWVLRDVLHLMGTKYSCGIGVCMACAVHLDGRAVPSCMIPISEVAGREITTIEGLGGAEPHPVHQAWREEEVSQCGYCQPGQMMTAAALLARTPSPTDAEIDAAMGEVLCRCGTYPRIRRAVKRAAGMRWE